MKIFTSHSLYFFAILMILVLPACKDNSCSFEDDQNIIEQYLKDNGLTAQKTDSGLHYIIKKEGIGSLHPGFNSAVTAKYKGYFSDGVVFDDSGESAITFTLGNTIVGWQEGIPLIKKEGEIQLFIPSSLAYGTQAVGGISGRECSVIMFDVTLEDFQ